MSEGTDWLFDLGNSRFKAAPWLGGEVVGEVQAWPHAGADLVHGDAGSAPLPRGRCAWLASVAAPELTAQVTALLEQRFEQVRLARTSAQCAGVRLAYPEPQRMGVDRFLALLGARALGGEQDEVETVGNLVYAVFDGYAGHGLPFKNESSIRGENADVAVRGPIVKPRAAVQQGQ